MRKRPRINLKSHQGMSPSACDQELFRVLCHITHERYNFSEGVMLLDLLEIFDAIDSYRGLSAPGYPDYIEQIKSRIRRVFYWANSDEFKKVKLGYELKRKQLKQTKYELESAPDKPDKTERHEISDPKEAERQAKEFPEQQAEITQDKVFIESLKFMQNDEVNNRFNAIGSNALKCRNSEKNTFLKKAKRVQVFSTLSPKEPARALIMYCFRCHRLKVSGLNCEFCGANHFQAFQTSKPLPNDDLLTHEQRFDEIRRLSAVVTNAQALIQEIASLNRAIRDRLGDKTESDPKIPEHFKVPNSPIPDPDSPPAALRRVLLPLQDAYELAKEILERLLEQNRLLGEQNRLLGERHELEAKVARRELLLCEVARLKAGATLEYLMRHSEVSSVSEIPDHLIPDSLRGTARKTSSISSGHFDSWREQS